MAFEYPAFEHTRTPRTQANEGNRQSGIQEFGGHRVTEEVASSSKSSPCRFISHQTLGWPLP